MKPLSELLSELSVRAKETEDHVSEAQKEAHDKVVARRDQSRVAIEDAINKVNDDLKSMGDTAGDKWRSLQTKIRSDMDALKADIGQRMHERDVRRADKHADRLEWEAALAVDYAVASIEQAELAIYDAIISRADAQQAQSAR